VSKNTTPDSATLSDSFSREEAIAELRVSPMTFWRLTKRPDFPKPIKIGRRTFYVKREIGAFVASLRESAA
jgi:predicted DNA-binding transcriptional regulator AlpA